MGVGKGGNSGSFKKGHKSVSPGRKPLPEDIKQARNMSYEEMCRTIIEVRKMTVREALEVDQNKLPLGKRAILNAFAKLDYRGIKEYEDRLWGRAKENIELDFGNDLNIIIKKPKNVN